MRNVSRFLNDFEQKQWASDIEMFSKWKAFFFAAQYEGTKKAARNSMLRIQARWPQFIKFFEIPEL